MDTNKRLSLLKLNDAILEHMALVPIGTYWRHYKDGDVYEVVGYGIDEATGEVMIDYIPELGLPQGMDPEYDEEGRAYHPIELHELPVEVEFKRRAALWFDTVDGVRRFTRVQPFTKFETVQ